MKKNKFFSLCMTLIILILCMVGCGKSTNELVKPTQSGKVTTKKTISAYSDIKINVALIKTLPGTYTFLQLIQDSDNHLNNINFFFAKDESEAFEWLDSGKVDAANLSYIAAIRYYNVGLKTTKMFFTTSYAPEYLLTNDSNENTFRYIEKKEIYFIGRASMEEYVFERNIVSYTRKQSRYADDLSELFKKIESGKVENCVVSSAVLPTISAKYPEFNVVSSVNDLSERANAYHNKTYDCFVISQDYLNENGSKIYDLASLFKTSSVFTNYHVDEAASIAVKYHIASSVDIAKDVILTSKTGYYKNDENRNIGYHGNFSDYNDYLDYYFNGNIPHSDYYTVSLGLFENQ